MNWDAIGAVGEVVGAIAVVVTLIFLTVQLKRNTKSIKAATRSQFAETISNTIANLQDKDFADVVTKGMNSPDSLDSSERLRFGSFVLRLIRTFEDAYFQSLEGDYDQSAWESNRSYMLDLLSISGIRSYFDTRKPWFDSRFVSYVEKELTAHKSGVELEYIEPLDQ